MIYLDYVSTTPLNPEVKEGYFKLLNEHFANADSLYNIGAKTSQIQEKARSLIAEMLKVKSTEIIYTTGASESNNMAIKGVAFNYQNRGKHIITSCMEHSSVYNAFVELRDVFGYDVDFIGLKQDYTLDLDELKSKMRDDTILVSIMHVNNEVGIINDLKAISAIVREYPKCKLHFDCVQSLGKLPVDLSLCDLASFSAHKINGLKGSGILYKKDNCNLVPIISGGQQEQSLRGGTSNTATNTMFAKTLRLALQKQTEHYNYVKEINTYCKNQLPSEVVVISNEHCSPYILSISLPHYKPEVILHYLESKEIYISTKSTCSSHKDALPHTIEAMHLKEEVSKSIIRVSFSHVTTKQEIDTFTQALQNAINELKRSQ